MEKICVVGLGQSGSKIANVIAQISGNDNVYAVNYAGINISCLNNIDNENLICLRNNSEYAKSPSLGLDFINNNLAIENKILKLINSLYKTNSDIILTTALKSETGAALLFKMIELYSRNILKKNHNNYIKRVGLVLVLPSKSEGYPAMNAVNDLLKNIYDHYEEQNSFFDYLILYNNQDFLEEYKSNKLDFRSYRDYANFIVAQMIQNKSYKNSSFIETLNKKSINRFKSDLVSIKDCFNYFVRHQADSNIKTQTINN